jgi:DNA-directed RNA polymerase subunit beta
MDSVLGPSEPLTLTGQAQPPAPASQPEYRRFGDAPATRRLLYDNVLKAAQQLEPVTNQRHTLALSDVRYEGPEHFSVAEQKNAILQRGTLGRMLRGTWTLSDNLTGQTLASRKSRLGSVPFLTDRGTFINRGNEYTLANQMRLRPGAFTRVKENGELETHMNFLPGKGRTHHIFLEPETGIFKMKVGQANIPLVSVLRTLGVNDQRLREAWGNDLAAVNIGKQDPQALTKLYTHLAKGPKVEDEVGRREAIANALRSMELDEDTTERTLKKRYKNLNEDVLLDVTRKLLRVSRGEDQPDDRDALEFQNFVGPEDVIPERITKGRNALRQLLWKATARGNLNNFPPGVFDDMFNSALMTSGLGMPLEEINPAEVFDQASRITRMGEGGIPSADSVPDEARAVQPSQFGFVDFLRTAESGNVGVDLRLARGAHKGADGRVYTQVLKPDGSSQWVSPQDLSKATLAFPGELRRNKGMVAALRNGNVEMVPKDKVDFVLPYMEDSFSPLGNMVPMKSMVKGQRAVMAARMMTQALPLTGGQAPLVQSGMPDREDWSFEQEYSDKMGSLRADQPGRVVSVDPNGITLQYQDGRQETKELYNNFPFNRKTFIHQTPMVQPGQVFQPGDLLARSNFTDDQGTTALGLNARVAYVPFRGLNFEDAVVISESMAKRMSSEHMYQHQQEFSDDHRTGKNSFISLFPSAYDRKTLDHFDENGVIQPGSEVRKGDPLILAARERGHSQAQVHRGRQPTFLNDTIVWEHDKPGIVTDVNFGPKGASVVVKSNSTMQVGDKLSGRYGDKGVVAGIIPDDDMPRDENERPFEILLNPLGIISRTNPAQIVETALGKIAERTGKPYKLKDFEDMDDAVEFALEELRKHGMNDLTDLIDPNTERKIPSVLSGNRWFMKLHHMAESKAQGRGLGAYTAEGTPAKGGETGSKRIGMLELNALMSHGATDVIRDASLIRGQASPEYWAQFMSGFKPPTPKVPFVYEKFVNQLKSSGINVLRDGGQVHIMALRDKDIDELAGDREIQNAETVDWRAGLQPKKGGLFDEKLTGGHAGRRWSFIRLHEPMPNPVMEEPIRRVLGLTKKKMEDVIAGKDSFGKGTGPKAIHDALKSINLDKELEQARADIKSGKRTARDAAIRKMGYLKDAQRLGIHPSEWMLTKAPVLPPAFRPVSQLGPKKLPMVADPNFLYKELFDANSLLKDLSGQLGDDVGEERLSVYKALRGVTGLGDPIHPRNKERQVKGILKHVFGNSPKVGVVQRRLLGSAVDLVGRSVITPNPDMDMDHVGIPESKAWEVYKPFIVRNLVRQGTSRLEAVRAVEERSQVARQTLLREMESRPVLINRAPTLHRYGMMAAYPKLVKGDTLQISPLIVGGFNADFDGDAMNYHVPSTDEAAREAAEKMLPSRNLFSAATFKVQYGPSQEYVGGLYEATARQDKLNKPLVFQTKADAIRAYKQGRINVDRQIVIMEN